jgi:pseudaminic acid synthase
MQIKNYLESKRTLIVAELSANHGHKKEIAIESIKAAKRTGADAVKLQTYTPDTLTIDCNNEYFAIREGLWKGRTLFELYKEAYTPWEWHGELFKVAKDEGILCFSAPFDKTAVDFLEQYQSSGIHKIASFGNYKTYHSIEYAASKGRPMIISTGMADTGRYPTGGDTRVLRCREQSISYVT